MASVFVMAVALWFAFNHHLDLAVAGNRGILFPSPNNWFADRTISFAVNLGMIVLMAASAVGLNRVFNIMRAQTAIWATFFVVAQTAIPSLSTVFTGGTLFCSVLIAATALLFTCFDNNESSRKVFLIFYLLSSAATFQYAAVFYIPVMVFGMAQMRIITLRSILAALLGIICPLWILFGCGIVRFADIRMPEIVNIFTRIDVADMALVLSVVAITIILGIMSVSGTVMKVVSYTAKYRASNGFWIIMLIATIALLIVDFNNLSIYIALLEFVTSYHLAHFFVSHRNPRSYIGILTIFAFYFAAYACAFFF